MMKRSRGLLLLLVLTLITGTASAQKNLPAEDNPPINPAGTEMFKLLLHLANFTPITENDLDTERINDSRRVIVVLFGSHRQHHLNWARHIVSNGGAVLIASDSASFYLWTADEFVQNGGSGVYFSGEHVLAPFRAPVHRDLVTCPFLQPVTPIPVPMNERPGPIWSLFSGLDRIAANQGTFLIPRYGGVVQVPLARYPQGSSIESNVNPLPPGAAFAVGGEGSSRQPYRFIAMGDQSVFINEMLVDEKLHNFTLATRMVEYLKDPDGEQRRYCLFIENGRTIQRFDTLAYALRNPPPPLPGLPPISQFQEKLVDVGNHLVDQMQKNDFANQSILGSGDPEQQNRRLRSLIGGLLLIATVYMMMQLLRRIWTSRHPQDAPPLPLTGRPSKPDPASAAGIFDRRRRELIRRDDLLELVQDAIRDLFLRAGAPNERSVKLPQVVIAEVVRRPETLHQALGWLWELAYGPPMRLNVKRWAELEPLFVRANRAFDDGKWRFAP